MLGAQRAAYQDLRAQVLAAVGGLRTEPGYQGLLDRLITMATRAAGPGAVVTARRTGAWWPGPPTSWSTARCPGWRPGVDELGDQVRELWTP